MKHYYLLLSLVLITACSSQGLFRKIASQDYVTSADELIERIQKAKKGETIVLDSYSRFDLTDTKPIIINVPLTLKASETDRKPHLFHNSPSTVFDVKAAGVKFLGLKITGKERDAKKEEIIQLNRTGVKGVYKFPVTRGITINAGNAVIKNCEISGFSHAAIFIVNVRGITIEENYIHHNQRWGLGYGVALHENAQAKIHRNQFNYNRHSVAGSGSKGQSYEASYNWFGPHHLASTLDMHGGKDRGDGTHIAGHTVYIHHNLILDRKNAIFIHRGIPENKVQIEHNEIHRSLKGAISYYNITARQLPPRKFIFQKNTFKKN